MTSAAPAASPAAAPVTAEELAAALPHVLAAPKTDAPIASLCWRARFNARSFPDRLLLTRGCGVPGERWRKHPWLTLPDGSPDPRIQVSILPTRVCDLVWRDRTGTPHPGDTIVADLDMSEANLPTGSLLQAGTAVLRVSDVFNDGCVKWKVRYGRAAKDWIVAEGHPPLRLRGVLCSIEQSGVVRLSDRLRKL
ncbi:hypothetical protein SAMN05421763_103533 [[Luteovulum] sphaeroides subsp. megalophilum]|uniref:hypothetical protein n=1 Tax=Cereibacter sphaeroides TaxID=1063 RepID=UPI0000664F7F|nr:hypothetical protein [Cereibacter sphaeroides]ABN78956.1 conserved hypothetical protein [Cereibacter sphaeroides ATCC 17029]EKX59775.1 hypothetical protein D516_0131 [Rhodobacter sp. AKP1]AZB65990.1 hypothetical protein EBL87_19945 [Cereibacter sphaeroides]AZB70809.1 hypothetical protein EBL86_20890 [Cereibacter sphaeroides]MWP37034.1 hypothetical protein [Cereibacter sphaeroides]